MLSLDAVAASLAWADPWLAPLFTAWGVPVSALEAWAFVLSILMVGFNLKVNPLGWPLAVASSVLYGILFARSRLYGEAMLQIIFVAVSLWGWWQWLRGVDAQSHALTVRALPRKSAMMAAGITLLMWPLLGLMLDRITDTDVPYFDALPTAGSLMGQWLLGRKWVENWPCWLAVNIVSMGLFAYKQLWLTVILYGIFALLSIWGWRQWGRIARRSARTAAGVPAAHQA